MSKPITTKVKFEYLKDAEEGLTKLVHSTPAESPKKKLRTGVLATFRLQKKTIKKRLKKENKKEREDKKEVKKIMKRFKKKFKKKMDT